MTVRFNVGVGVSSSGTSVLLLVWRARNPLPTDALSTLCTQVVGHPRRRPRQECRTASSVTPPCLDTSLWVFVFVSSRCSLFCFFVLSACVIASQSFHFFKTNQRSLSRCSNDQTRHRHHSFHSIPAPEHDDSESEHHHKQRSTQCPLTQGA